MEKMDLEKYQKEVAVLRTQLEVSQPIAENCVHFCQIPFCIEFTFKPWLIAWYLLCLQSLCRLQIERSYRSKPMQKSTRR